MAEKLGRPCSSSAHTSPSTTQSGVRTALHERLRHAREALGEVVPVPRDEPRLSRPDIPERPVAVPLRLEYPVTAWGQLLRQRREHRPVVVPRSGMTGFADQEPIPFVAVEVRGHERPRPVEPLAVQPDGEPAVLLLLEELVRAVVPDLDACRRRTRPSGSRPRSSRRRAGGPRRARRARGRRAPGGCPWAPPTRRARRRARAGSRSGAGARRGAGRRRSAPGRRGGGPRTAPVSVPGSRLRSYSLSGFTGFKS